MSTGMCMTSTINMDMSQAIRPRSPIATRTGTHGSNTSTRITRTCIIVTGTSACERGAERRPMLGRSQMTTQAAQEHNLEHAIPLAAIFMGFLKVALYGIGRSGGLVWARRIAVEQRRWISEQDFADIVSLCQFMPGPNIVGIAVCVGTKLCGWIGAIVAVAGFLLIPWTIGFTLGVLYLQHAHHPAFQNILGGISAAAAGLLIATGIKMLLPHRGQPAAVLFAALAFGLMAFGKLLFVLLGLAPLSVAVTGIARAR
jgi:chromate transporter